MLNFHSLVYLMQGRFSGECLSKSTCYTVFIRQQACTLVQNVNNYRLQVRLHTQINAVIHRKVIYSIEHPMAQRLHTNVSKIA